MNYLKLKKPLNIALVVSSIFLVLSSIASADIIQNDPALDFSITGADPGYVDQVKNGFIPNQFVDNVWPVVDLTGEGGITGADVGYSNQNKNGFDNFITGNTVPPSPTTNQIATILSGSPNPNYGRELPIEITDPLSGSTREVTPASVINITFSVDNTIGPSLGIEPLAITVDKIPITFEIIYSTCAGAVLSGTKNVWNGIDDWNPVPDTGTLIGAPGCSPGPATNTTCTPGNPPSDGIPVVAISAPSPVPTDGSWFSRGTVSVDLDVGAAGGCMIIIEARCNVHAFDTENLLSPKIVFLKTLSVQIPVKVLGGIINITSPAEGATFATNQVSVAVTTDAVDGTIVNIEANGIVVPGKTCSVSSGQCTVANVTLPEGPVTLIALIPGGSSPEVHVVVDSVAPQVSITSPASGVIFTTNNIQVTVTADDPIPGSGVALVKVNGETATKVNGYWEIVLTGLTDGSNTITAEATDNYGNVSLPAAVNITIDTQRPVVNIINPADGSTITATSVIVYGTVNDPPPGTGIVTVLVNGQTAVLDLLKGEFFISLSGLAQGSNSITATAWDLAGEDGSDSISVFVDSIGPATPIITSPLPGPTSNNTPTIVGTAEPGTFIEILEPDGGVSWGIVQVDGLGNFSITLPAMVDGPHTLVAFATDSAGNTSDDS
ncbi:MAG: hypothetical protein JSU92_04620, partial [Deltaproteobacteria bacterium]